jgi:MFS family permease
MERTHDPLAALRSPAYQRLLCGTVLASIGTEMQSVVVGWELYQRTGSAAALGLVGLVQIVPVLLLSLPAGHAADRYQRQLLVVVSQSLMASASLGLALLSCLHFQGVVPLIYLCLLLTGISQAFNSPARWALVSQVVPESDLANAITWNSSGWQMASVLGPALGGLILDLTGRAVSALAVAGCCSLCCAALVGPIRGRSIKRLREPLSLNSLVAGIRFVRNTPPILATITLDLFAVLLGGATALLPIYAQDILQVGPGGLGLLRAAPSLGALVMAMALAFRPPLRRAGRTLLIAVAGFGLATIVFGLSRNFPLSLAALAFTGALDNISVVVRGTLVQVLTPDAMRGRVSAVNAIFISSSNQLGAFESGSTAYWFGPVLSVVGGGIGTILMVLAVMVIWPEVLRLGSLSQGGLGEEADSSLMLAEKGSGSP